MNFLNPSLVNSVAYSLSLFVDVLPESDRVHRVSSLAAPGEDGAFWYLLALYFYWIKIKNSARGLMKFLKI